jgi:ribosomal protein S27E
MHFSIINGFFLTVGCSYCNNDLRTVVNVESVL